MQLNISTSIQYPPNPWETKLILELMFLRVWTSTSYSSLPFPSMSPSPFVESCYRKDVLFASGILLLAIWAISYAKPTHAPFKRNWFFPRFNFPPLFLLIAFVHRILWRQFIKSLRIVSSLSVICGRNGKGETEYAYTVLIHPLPPFGFVTFIVFHKRLHQVLGSLGSSRFIWCGAGMRGGTFTSWRWRWFDLLYFTCKDPIKISFSGQQIWKESLKAYV